MMRAKLVLIPPRLTPNPKPKPDEEQAMGASFADDLRAARAAKRNEIRTLRQAGATRRGLSDDFYALIAQSYRELTSVGEPHLVTALAIRENVDKSTASRWIGEARRRGLLP